MSDSSFDRFNGIVDALFVEISALLELGISYSEIARGLAIDGGTLRKMIIKKQMEDAIKKLVHRHIHCDFLSA